MQRTFVQNIVFKDTVTSHYNEFLVGKGKGSFVGRYFKLLFRLRIDPVFLKAVSCSTCAHLVLWLIVCLFTPVTLTAKYLLFLIP